MIDILRRIKKRVSNNAEEHVKGPFSCPVCQREDVQIDPFPIYYFIEMHKYGFIHNVFLSETINFAHYSCKNCGASDRDRMYALYLSTYFKKTKAAISLLDIAPAPALANFIKGFQNVKYRSMDLYMEGVDDHFDITNMHGYKEGQFDFLICSHVLEHIPDDIKAMQELYRILKPGGHGIMMVPINLGVKETMEDPTCTDIPTRWKLYGQDDHIRMYAKEDFIQRLESVGFGVKMLDKDYFGEEVFAKCGIYPTSVLYIVSK